MEWLYLVLVAHGSNQSGVLCPRRLGVHICSVFQKHPGRHEVASLDREDEGSDASLAGLGINVGVVLEEDLNRLTPRLLGCEGESSASVLVALVSSSMAQKTRHNLVVSLLEAHVREG